MSLAQALLAEFENEASTTRKFLERLFLEPCNYEA